MYLVITESIDSVTQVFERDASVKCQDNFERTKRLYKRSLFFGCRGLRSISDISSLAREISSVLCSLSDIWKSKNFPRYLKDSPILIVGTGQLLISSFGKNWHDFDKIFFIPKVLHLSTLIFMFDHWHQIENRFKRYWFSKSWPVITAASSANWNQWMGFRKLKVKPNCRYLSALMCWINVLKHMLNSRGLRQSPCSTPRPTVMNGVRNSEVIMDDLKSVYKHLIALLICSGIWW